METAIGRRYKEGFQYADREMLEEEKKALGHLKRIGWFGIASGLVGLVVGRRSSDRGMSRLSGLMNKIGVGVLSVGVATHVVGSRAQNIIDEIGREQFGHMDKY